MIHLPASVRVYLATSPCDMRRSFDGLHALVNGVLHLDVKHDASPSLGTSFSGTTSSERPTDSTSRASC